MMPAPPRGARAPHGPRERTEGLPMGTGDRKPMVAIAIVLVAVVAAVLLLG
jgi:hypothetical protein